MVVSCEVKFDSNPNAIYFAGQTLSGVVEMTIDKPKKIRGLILKIEGCAKVEWTETETHHNSHHNNNNGSHTRSVTYSGREDYISSTSYLIGSPHGNQIEISPGQYRYNFQSMLPAQIPTSCEASHGSIRYLVNVIMDRPFKFDLTYKVAFTVIKQLDLNYENPTLSIPLKMEASKTFCCWICKSKPVFMAASIPISGYVPGQTITVSVDINNESNVDFEDVKITLKKFLRYNSQVPIMKTKEEVVTEAEVRYGAVKKESRCNFMQHLIIPPVPPTNLNYCRVLNVSYEVQIKCKGPTFSGDPVIRLPITIGTVPLQMSVIPQMTANHQPTAPVLSPSPVNYTSYDNMIGSFAQPSSSYNEPPPPSYYDAVYTEANGNAIELNEAGEHTMGTQPFHPKYPVYGFHNLQLEHSNEQPQQQLEDYPANLTNIQKF